MKALLVLAAVAGTAFVGYSYTSTDGQSCAVCPLTGEPIMTSTESKGGCCSGCATEEDLLLTGVEGEKSSSCGQSGCAMCEACNKEGGEDMLTSVAGEQCEACNRGASDANAPPAIEVIDAEAPPTIEVIE